MAPASPSPGQLQRAASSEPTTRPNPFDDDNDSSSRKRQRTSVSGSPAQSNDAAADTNAGTSAPHILSHAAAAGGEESSTEAGRRTSEVDMISDLPQTSERPSNTDHYPPETPSNKVTTINLRAMQEDGETYMFPKPPLSRSQLDQISANRDNVKESVEGAELDLVQPSSNDVETPKSSSMSDSPAVEVITIQDDGYDEDEADHTNDLAANAGISIVGRRRALSDPTENFPYAEPDETLPETVQRLSHYINTQTPLDNAVLRRIQDWLRVCIEFVSHADYQLLLSSLRVNRGFWLALPELLFALFTRKPNLLDATLLRETVMDIYISFGKLAAKFIDLDRYLLQHLQPQMAPDRRPPDLWSLHYLQQVSAVTRRPDLSLELELERSSLPATYEADDVSLLLSEFLGAPGGNLDHLKRFAAALIDQLPTFPRLAEGLGPVSQILVNIVREFLRLHRTGSQEVRRATQQLKLGHELFSMISSSLISMVEKQVTHLNPEGTLNQIRALTDVLKICLHSDHKLSLDTLREYQQAYPQLAVEHIPEAASWKWRFDVLAELVRSSQMQLRMSAVTTMCSDLVAIWKSLSAPKDEGSKSLLNFIGVYLLQSKLIDYILSPSCHPEIIVESANIIGFLVMAELYTEEHTERLWQGITSSKDPRIADALTRMVTNITPLFDYRGCVGHSNQLQNLPVEAFTPTIRSLWEQLLKQMVQQYQKVGLLLSLHPYSLCLRILRESSVRAPASQIAHPEIHSFALQKLEVLLVHGPDAAGRHELYSNCIEDIAAKSPTTLGSIWCLWMAIRPVLVPELQVLTDQHNLTQLLVEELQHAIKEALASSTSGALSGHANQPRRDLITNIILHQPATLDKVLGLKLWNLLVGPDSACPEDRTAGWQIILDAGITTSLKNPYLHTCLTEFLPALPPLFFSDGMLDLIRMEVLPLVAQDGTLILDDEEAVVESGIEHLWRVIFSAKNNDIVTRTIHTLAVDIYMESPSIRSLTLHRARNVHLFLVNRCLHQLKEAARRLRAFSIGIPSADDEPMVIVAVEEQIEEQERIFIRSLQLLRYFLEAHQSKPQFDAPDLRSLMSDVPYRIEGDLAHLTYQSFDGSNQTDVRPLNIGKLNTAASLLASLRQETGFEYYRAYYKGQPFLPTEEEICRSLEDLRVHDGLILVKREEDGAAPTARIKPRSSPLELEILSHFDELWQCLSMEEHLAKEIYNFLTRLPAHGSIMSLFENEGTAYEDVFPRGESFKSLYAIHALREYINTARQTNNIANGSASPGNFTSSSFAEALNKSLSLVVQAISDETTTEEQTSRIMQKQLTATYIHTLLQLLQDVQIVDSASRSFAFPPYARLLQVLSDAAVERDELAISLTSSSLATILRLALMKTEFWKAVSADDRFQKILLKLILQDDRKAMRNTAVNLIEDIVDQECQRAFESSGGFPSERTISTHSIASYLWKTVVGVLPRTVDVPEFCQELFRVFHFLLIRVANINPELLDLDKLLQQTSGLLLRHTSTEVIDQDEPYDAVSEGLSSLSLLCLQMDDSLSSSDQLPKDLAQQLLSCHLFPQHREHPDQPVPRVVLNTNTRSKLCEIVFRLIRHDREKFISMLRSLNSLVPYYALDDAVDSPYHYDLPCPFDRSKAMRSSSGYTGLKNLSNTCYLNSLLTQLYMNPGFRRFILSTKLQEPLGSQQLLFFTQKVFAYMQESYARFVDPNDLVMCVKTPEDTPIDIHNQMDVDEFYSLLFDRWEGQLATSEERKQLRAFYGGQLVQQVKSKECEHISERLEAFSAIQCDIKGKSTLQESLQAYVDGEIMEGDNKYKCSTCDRHVDAVKRACLKDIPDHLIFHLKRFDFNLRTLQRSKINDYFSFPTTIDMQPYTIEHLSGTDTQGDEDVFELVGVLVHSGTAESGHYYSYIRERPSSGPAPSWVEYNDDVVTSWDPALMETSTFGGADNRALYDANGIAYDKSYSAYMLFYQRASSLKREVDAMKISHLTGPFKVDIEPRLKEAILTENTMILRRHCLFDPSHISFVQQCFERARVSDEETAARVDSEGDDDTDPGQAPSHGLKSLAMKMALGHLDQIVSRNRDLSQFDPFAAMINSAINRCGNSAYLFFDYFNQRRGAFRALLQRNPEVRVRIIAGQMLLAALRKIGSEMPHMYNSGDLISTPPDIGDDEEDMALDQGSRSRNRAPSVLESAVGIFNYLWRFFHVSIRSWDEYFGTMLGFAKLGSREVAHLLASDYLLKMLRIAAADQLLELPGNYARMLHNVLRRLSTRAPSYNAVIAVIDYLLQQLEPILDPQAIVDAPNDRLYCPGPRYPWSAGEIMFLFHHPEHRDISFFLEKLLGIDQAREHTASIVGKLVGAGAEMEGTVQRTLRKNIRGATSTQAMDPFLRGAATYIEYTESEAHAQDLAIYVCSQAKHLQNTEGYAFLDFVRTCLQLRRDDEEFVESMHDFTVETFADWAPYLLVYGEPEVRAETEELLHSELFRVPPSMVTDPNLGEDAQAQLVIETVRRLGHACLVYLREAHVKRRVQLGREAAATIIQVIGDCREYFERDADAIDEAWIEFDHLYNEVMGALRRLIVDEVEDDGSGWEGSYASSEPMDDFAELTMQAVKEANNMDTTA
ncbi:Ubiquitin carboxyl-terminal hydrolase [Paramyrothecium foliicola]|nr:Ubiquitin carboxyl-terminal hydrolase [Paramyrothecium foliicola]